MAALADRLRARHDELATRIVERYRAEIVDYAASSPEFIEHEVLPVASRGLTHVLDNIAANSRTPSREQVEEFRRMLGRRPHQAIALPSIQAAFRLFSEFLYDELAAAASPDDPDELQAVIRGGAVMWRFSHEVIGIVTQTYLDELEDVRGDREIVNRSLLDAVLAGRSSLPSSVRDARILGIELIPQNVVIVARGDTEEQRPRTLRQAARVLREQLREDLEEQGRALVGVREGEVVCVCPAPKPRDARPVAKAADRAAPLLAEFGMSIGVGCWHPLAEEIPAAYAEAREAAVAAVRLGLEERALPYDDVLIDQLLRDAATAGRVIGTALRPLHEYDALRNAGLVDTLRAYIDSNFSISGAARAMHIANNTAVYRLDRICELTGRDPRDPRDVVFLALSLRLST